MWAIGLNPASRSSVPQYSEVEEWITIRKKIWISVRKGRGALLGTVAFRLRAIGGAGVQQGQLRAWLGVSDLEAPEARAAGREADEGESALSRLSTAQT